MVGNAAADRPGSPPPAVSAFVDAVVSESFDQERVSGVNAQEKPVATPAGSVDIVVSQVALGQKDRIDLRIRFRRPGRVTIRLPQSWSGAKDSNLRSYDVRPWPTRAVVPAGSVRAGAGPLAAGFELANGVIAEPGGAVSIRLRLTGAAAMAVDVAPDVSVVRTDSAGGEMAIERTIVVNVGVDWGDSTGQAMSRTWYYEWRPRQSGSYRIQPIRLTHLDDRGRAQTLLVTAPAIEVLPRPLFRAKVASADQPLRSTGGTRGGLGPGGWLAVSLATTAACAAIYASLRGRCRFLAWSLRRKLKSACSPESALAAWRAIEPAWRACRKNASPGAIEDYERLSQRAFGRAEAESNRLNDG